ncbi:30S ribosomal protein S8e [archaeon]|jgi:small subunit ribosomal protein S8e|nr:30S ribosomal protein S8e [archaeon]
MKSQERPRRKVSGSRYVNFRKKKFALMGRDPTLSKVGERKVKNLRGRGGGKKEILYSDKLVNVFNPKSKKYEKTEIKNVVENPANRHYVRRNILTKGTVVETSLGKAKITSRPGQEAVLNGVLI